MISNKLKGFPSVTCWRGYFLSKKKQDFGATSAIKQERQMCRIWGGADLVAASGMWLRNCYADDGGGGERWRRTS